jgi:hypothetical protein
MKNITSKKFDVKSVMDASETAELEKASQNETLIRALKKLILFGPYYSGILEAGKEPEMDVNFAIQGAIMAIYADPKVNDEDLGRNLRASVSAMGLIEGGFKELNSFKPEEKGDENLVNEAR